ncbi:MAG: glycoside hydrolase family 3 N-terminal domain-containing protein [Saprospiraceae bacterium]
MKISTLILIFFLLFSTNEVPSNNTPTSTASKSLQAETDWVNEQFDQMSEAERLGQLFMIRAHSDLGPDHIAKVKNQIKKYHVGSLCFFQGTPEKQAELTNEYQQLSLRVPLMIAMDAEWGLGMRLKKSTISFPYHLTMGAIQDNRLIYNFGREVARQCRRLGVHINFAPVADVNNNPENPVINTRSFGEDRYNVAVKSYMYTQGMQDGNLMACAKHFPGHGDTDTDSHYDLPVIDHDRNRLDSIELFPFKVLAEHGIQSMMVAHMQVNSIDDTKNLPTTLSTKAVNDLLKNKMGFEGLIFTDGLGMKGVTKHHKIGEVEAKALVAGNDILLLPQDVGAAVEAIQRFVAEGKLKQSQLDNSIKKVLRAKYRLGLTEPQSVAVKNIRADLNNTKAKLLNKKLIQNALTLARDKNNVIPFKEIANLTDLRQQTGNTITALSLGSETKTEFQRSLSKMAPVDFANAGKKISGSKIKSLVEKLKDKKAVIIGLHDMSSYSSKGFGITASQRELIRLLSKETEVVLTVFGNPYALKYFDNVNTVLVAYSEDELSQDAAAQALFGVFPIRGKLPVTATSKSKFNQGKMTTATFRLGYAQPESVGLNERILELGIDSLAELAIKEKATPGCVVLVAKDGKVVFNKAYGHHTYSKRTRMEADHVFDLASITKIAATTVSIMKLHEEGRINVYQPISEYLPELKGTNKADLTIYDIMAHRAGLKGWIPFYEQTVTTKKKPSPAFYSKNRSSKFNTPVTERLFMLSSFEDDMRQQIRESELRASRDYKYSDLGFYMLADLVQRISGQSINDFVAMNFYNPMGLKDITYLPREKFGTTDIVPTEEDKYFRRQRIQGNVHDMGAAMLGGVSGHAGLFSTSTDLAAVMQMLLNDGYYGGRQYLQSSTVRTFINRHADCTRRGIGFDLKELNENKSQNMCPEASINTFGHLGFTGTSTWADPDSNLIFVFLSNRTYPSMHNYKLNKIDIRPRMQSVAYKAME